MPISIGLPSCNGTCRRNGRKRDDHYSEDGKQLFTHFSFPFLEEICFFRSAALDAFSL
jgi:hypothetical protein